MVALAAAQMLADDVDAWGMPVLRALLPIAGMTLIEQQAERAKAAGASRFLLLVDGVPPTLAEACDRIQARGLEVQLVRDGDQVAEGAAGFRKILLIADGLIAGDKAWWSIPLAEPPTLLAVADESATRTLERIDGDTRWAGIAVLPGQSAAALADTPPDWDPQLTLLRQAIQMDAQHMDCPTSWFVSGEMQLALTPVQAAEAEDRLLGERVETAHGLCERWLWGPLLRLAAPWLLARQVSGKSARVVDMLAGLAAMGFALSAMAVPAAVCAVIAAANGALARFLADFRPESQTWRWSGYVASALGVMTLAVADRHLVLPTFAHTANGNGWWGAGAMTACFAVLVGRIWAQGRHATEDDHAVLTADEGAIWLAFLVVYPLVGWRSAFDIIGIAAMLLLIIGMLRNRAGTPSPHSGNAV